MKNPRGGGCYIIPRFMDVLAPSYSAPECSRSTAAKITEIEPDPRRQTKTQDLHTLLPWNWNALRSTLDTPLAA